MITKRWQNVTKGLLKRKQRCVEHPVVLRKRCNYAIVHAVLLLQQGLCTRCCWLDKTHETPTKWDKMYIKARCTPFQGNMSFNPETGSTRVLSSWRVMAFSLLSFHTHPSCSVFVWWWTHDHWHKPVQERPVHKDINPTVVKRQCAQ